VCHGAKNTKQHIPYIGRGIPYCIDFPQGGYPKVRCSLRNFPFTNGHQSGGFSTTTFSDIAICHSKRWHIIYLYLSIYLYIYRYTSLTDLRQASWSPAVQRISHPWDQKFDPESTGWSGWGGWARRLGHDMVVRSRSIATGWMGELKKMRNHTWELPDVRCLFEWNILTRCTKKSNNKCYKNFNHKSTLNLRSFSFPCPDKSHFGPYGSHTCQTSSFKTHKSG
jgi:hypothetical protein